MKTTLEKAIETFGREPQMRMVQEECAELIQAINKYIRKGNGEGSSNLCEEIADVEIMIAQLRIMLNADAVIDGIKESKIERLKNRLNENSTNRPR